MLACTNLVRRILRPTELKALTTLSKENEKDESHPTFILNNMHLGRATLGTFALAALAFPSHALAESNTAPAAAELASSVGPQLTNFLMFAPPVCAQFLFLSGLNVIKKIKAEKRTGDLTPLPFISMYTNCAVWSMYGLMVSDFTVLAPNFSGLFLGIYLTKVFHDHNSGQPLTNLYLGSAAIVGGCAASAAFLPMEIASQITGYMGCAMAVFLMSSPLAVLKTVIQEKSTASLPFLTSVATFANASTWTGFQVINQFLLTLTSSASIH
jgi:solute carrier family 50 protein (sugar transporter)